jgi:transposase
MNFGKRTKVFVCRESVDMRKSYDGLYGLVRASIGNPLSGDVYLFLSRSRTRAKALFWDGNGLNIWMKRMEEGQFPDVFTRAEMTVTELALFFEGSTAVKQKISVEDLTKRFAA